MAKYCRSLEELNVDHCSQVTERGVKVLAGRSRSEVSSLESHYGCRGLRYISLQGCAAVHDQAIWYLLLHCKKLQILRYHQSYSVAEILCNELRKLEQLPSLSLQSFDHPFPYGINIPDEEVVRVSQCCPDIRVLNLVSLDKFLPSYAHFHNMTKATIEMEDAFGLGLYKFIETIGGNLKEFTISCGSDPDSTLLEGGGRTFELFNVGLRLARRFCPQLTMLSISGCGLVTNDLLEHMQSQREEFQCQRPMMTKLRTLILLTYHDSDETPIQTCEEDLLFSTIRGNLLESFMSVVVYPNLFLT